VVCKGTRNGKAPRPAVSVCTDGIGLSIGVAPVTRWDGLLPPEVSNGSKAQLIRKDGLCIVASETRVQQFTQLSLRGYCQEGDLVIDVHVSAMNPSPAQRTRMMAMLESVRVHKRQEPAQPLPAQEQAGGA